MGDGFVTLGEFLNSWVGGATSTLIAGAAGRLMWHTGEVRRGKRRFWGLELLWEIPICFGMALIGESLTAYLELSQPMSTGVIAALAYLGPRGAEVMLMNWIGRKAK